MAYENEVARAMEMQIAAEERANRGREMERDVVVVTTQPKFTQNQERLNPIIKHDWHSSTFNCCKNTHVCCCTTFCTPCFTGSMSSKIDENYCVCCLGPMGILAIREKLRVVYGLKGDICGDACCMCFCYCCVMCQTFNEIEFRVHQN